MNRSHYSHSSPIVAQDWSGGGGPRRRSLTGEHSFDSPANMAQSKLNSPHLSMRTPELSSSAQFASFPSPKGRISPSPRRIVKYDRDDRDSMEMDRAYTSEFRLAPPPFSPTRPTSPATVRSRQRLYTLSAIVVGVVLLGLSVFKSEHVQSTISDVWTGSRAIEVTKMEACGMCASSPEICAKYGPESIQLTRAYQGTGRRIQRVLGKAKRGEKITIGILGGSVSEGYGVPANRRWHEVVQGWFNATFPRTPNELVNGAVPGRGTEYFMSCHGEHIARESDLVIIELGVNDWHSGFPYDVDMESLVRALLSYPNKPAIIFAETFSLTLPKLSMGTDAHLGVANFYDIPVIALRNWLLPELLFDSHAKDAYFFGDRDGTGQHNDYLHIGPETHVAFGELVNALLDQQLCLSKHGPPPSSPRNIDSPWPNHYSAHGMTGRIPRLRLQDSWDDSLKIGVPESKCLSLNSPKPESQLTFNEAQSNGWYKWDDEIPWRHVKTYLRGDKFGDKIVFSGIETVDGTWTLYYLRSNKKGLGNLWCWVDNDREHAIWVEGWWERKMDVGEVLPMHTGLSRGKHDITCEIEHNTHDPGGGHTFLIIAIMYV